MAETVAVDPPPVAETVGVSASVLAQHLDCSRTYVGKLEAEGVIQRHGDGFPLDQSSALPTFDTCGASGGNRHGLDRLNKIASAILIQSI